ncbi:hypothetical protein ACJX0J_021285, partial [Zea mays]
GFFKCLCFGYFVAFMEEVKEAPVSILLYTASFTIASISFSLNIFQPLHIPMHKRPDVNAVQSSNQTTIYLVRENPCHQNMARLQGLAVMAGSQSQLVSTLRPSIHAAEISGVEAKVNTDEELIDAHPNESTENALLEVLCLKILPILIYADSDSFKLI